MHDERSSKRISAVSSGARDPMRINWKAVKATALLFPLLGLTHLMFCINPKDDATFEEAYMITNAILQSSQTCVTHISMRFYFRISERNLVFFSQCHLQIINENFMTAYKAFLGFFVGLLYCFMNSEVQTVVRNSYLRAVIRRNPNHKYTRTRSLPRTSTAFLSHTEVSMADTARHKVAPHRKNLMPLREVSVNGKKAEDDKNMERTYVF
ncbi:uncharacterized protein TNCT_98601 [Trichonephila clavata]|uniref:Uncharacterized protein n=1 Tax=Trichonephila clavata TaxID=2740835 RepID=A0A8X6G6D5_TRICU|nr:uncharacterized protein TNCT_98601 [Trichonephila clavata]